MHILENGDTNVLVLNEMDIGMSRSGNIHTTRMLAFRLKMNYAWGLEFLELTSGTHEEQVKTEGKRDLLGLHGNAILSRCPITNPKLFRDPLVGGYYTDSKSAVNADGS